MIGYANADQRGNDALWALGLGWNADLNQRGTTPIGFTMYVDVDKLGLTPEDVGTSVGFGAGVFYTGRPDVTIGAELGTRRVPLKDPPGDMWSTSMFFTMRYFF